MIDDSQGLPEEIRQLLGEDEQDMPSLSSIANDIIGKRNKAVAFRNNSGIEAVWLKCEESYLSIDDANRSEFSGAKWAKPVSIDGPVTASNQAPQTGEYRSTAFIPMTARYVDAGSAKIGEIILPIDDKSFTFSATPIPEMVEAKESNAVIKANVNGQQIPLENPDTGEPLKASDLIEEKIVAATKAAKKAESRIYDWMVESAFQAENRKIIFDGARIGVGVLKGPFAEVRQSMAMSTTEAANTAKLEIKQEIKPAYRWADPWNIYPDPSCGENIQHGDYVFERDYLSGRQVKKLKKDPSYIKSQVDRVIEQGPSRSTKDGAGPKEGNNEDGRYPVWYYYGSVKKEDFLALNPAKRDSITSDEVYAIVTLINDVPVRAVINPLDTGKFPYHAFTWRRRAGSWAGVGIAEQIEMPQRMGNATLRAALNNAGKSAGSLIVIDDSMIQPADNSPVLTPDKIFNKVPDSILDDVRKAVAVFQVPNMTPQLLQLLEQSYRIAEESCSVPLISQGQSGKTTPDTFGSAQLQDNNANQLLRSIGYQYDDQITEPVVIQSYELLLLDPEVPNDEKGDWEINAHGSSSLVEKSIQDQTLQAMGQYVLNPVFKKSPAKWFDQWLKSKRLDPRDFDLDEDEMKAAAEQQPPPAPQVQAAQINAATAEKVATIRAQTDLQRAKVDTDRDTIFQETLKDKQALDQMSTLKELEIRRELAILDYANKREMKLEEVKADLARTAMIERTRKQLASMELAAAEVTDNNSLVRDEMYTPDTP